LYDQRPSASWRTKKPEVPNKRERLMVQIQSKSKDLNALWRAVSSSPYLKPEEPGV
jgi:hypothetical protein